MKQTRRLESGSDEGCRIESAVHVVNPRINGAGSERQTTPLLEVERQERLVRGSWMTQNSYVKALTLQCDGTWRWGFENIIGVI